MDGDLVAIKAAVEAFQNTFAELEHALSSLLNAVLAIPNSNVAYAIYFSPTSFDARAEIAENAVIQIASENTPIVGLIDLWPRVEKKIASSRRLRNALAHGKLQTIYLRGKLHPRFSPLAFDAIRLGRPMARGEIPGLSANEIRQGTKTAQMAWQWIDRVNQIVTAFRAGDPTLPQKFRALKADLTASRSQ